MKWHYIYILDVDNRGVPNKKRFGNTKEYYTGETDNIARRTKQHLRGIGSKYLKNNWPNARKTLVFVKYFYGTYAEILREEKRIKRFPRKKKKALIDSEQNVLLHYVPFKAIILKKNNREGEEVAIRL